MFDDQPLYVPQAELTAAGAAVYSAEGARNAHRLLVAGDFHDPALGDLFAVGPELPTEHEPGHDPLAFDAPLLWEVRASAAADLTGIRLTDVREVVSRRLVLVDTTGYFARQVKAAAAARAERRRRVVELAEEAEQLGYRLVPADREPAR